MLNLKDILIDLSTTLLAAAIGLVLIKRLTFFHRILLLQVLLYVVADLFSATNNNISAKIYNIYLPLEFMLISFACLVSYNSKALKIFCFFLFLVYLSIYVYDVLNLQGFYHHAAICAGIITTVNCLLFLFEEMANENGERSLSKTLAIVGLLLYFAGCIPYLTLVFYFQKLNPELNRTLWGNIIVFLAWLRYLLLALSYLFVLRKPKINHERNWST